MLKKFATSTTLLSLLAVSALNADSKAYIAGDNLGDFLIAPLVVAKNDTCTRIDLFNSNESNSFLLKIAIRGHLRSREVDMPLFLSPGDAWSGTLCQRDDGDVYLTSNDDSNHPDAKKELNEGVNISKHSRDANEFGNFQNAYCEIYPIAQYNEHSNLKVNKATLVKRYDRLIAGDLSDSKLVKNVDGYSLSGSVTFLRTQDDQYGKTLPLMAFKGAHDKVVTGATINYASKTSPQLLLGMKSTNEILKALQNRKVSFMYNNFGKNQFINFTFPFGYQAGQTRTYEVTVRDMSENKDSTHIKKQFFSPKIIKVTASQKLENEIASVSIAKIISETFNKSINFEKGLIQIKEIRNTDSIQLGRDAIASSIPVKVVAETAKDNCLFDIYDISYIPRNR